MRSLERRYKNIEKKNPVWSSYLCFVEAVRKQNFTKRIMSKWFRILVDPDDYSRTDKRDILKHLYSLSNSVEDDTKASKN